ncbi:uncharacterized protein LOC128399648 isoform X2 [Podarcis raffonei]|uniref:uncharacterized protein LOC128399648 isoform X2 n=1 Tax=Podarcis raffonei TaxID=65483 RepID=UPI00232947FD|nr:uncharacterized protein LOC128399648 isoform X2 [Podarcis raffonei]
MEQTVSRSRLGFSLLSVTFLLCLTSGAFGSIDPDKLKAIIDYIREFGLPNNHYAVAVRLDNTYCRNPTRQNLETALPRNQMNQMRTAIRRQNGMYNPQQIGDVVAARPRFLTYSAEHAEWRLLNGGQNSPVARILANKDQNSCLIFFSKLSPCVNRCLNENSMRNIVQVVNPLFNRFNEDARAFVFEFIYARDAEKEDEVVLGAWQRIQNAPLFRCYAGNRACIKCFNHDQSDTDSPCLAN